MRSQREGTLQQLERVILTPAEAAFVAELPRKMVDQAIDRAEVELAQRGGNARGLDESTVVYLRIRNDIGDLLTAKARREVYDALRTERPLRSRLEFGPIVVSTKKAIHDVRERMQRVRQARAAVNVDPEIRGGEPVVRGTRIPIQMLANLAKAGESRERMLEDYPAIDAKLLEDALLYVSLYPRRGRPRAAPWHGQVACREFRPNELRANR